LTLLRRLAAVATSLPVRVLVSAGLLALVAASIDWGSVSEALADAGWGWFALATVLAFLASLVAAVRWNALLHAAGLGVSAYEAVRAYMIGTFANNFLPTAYGGDAVRGWIVGRSGKPLVRALTSVVADRVTALACLLLVAWVAAVIKAGDIPGDVLALLAAVTAIAIAAGAAVLIAIRRQGLGRFLPGAVRPWAGEAASVLRTYDRDRPLQLEVLVLGLVYQAMIISAFWLIAVGLDLGLDPAELTLAVPPVLIVAALPISIAGFGVREGAFVVVLGEFGISAADATLLSLLSVVAVSLASAPGGLAIVLRRGGTTPRAGDGLEGGRGLPSELN
jgi:glycosyltransferase 2 family protein